MQLEGKKILVVGLGKSGVSAARFLSSKGAKVTAADLKDASEIDGVIKALEGMPVNFSLGPHEPKIFEEAEVMVLSPGVPLDMPHINAARARGVPILGEMELAVSLIKKPVVAVTGTNGKTTTTALIGHLLNNSGVRACVAGNIGTPLLDVIDEANSSDFVVLEVSSFQIETAPSLKPKFAILLNVTPDHLDRHASLERYIEIKADLIRNVSRDGFGIYNAADENVARAVMTSQCTLIPFDATGRILKKSNDGPRAWFEGGELLVRTSGENVSRYPLSLAKLEGVHNRENMLSALVVAELCGAYENELKKALPTFIGLPHRVELVAEYKGVRYYDDSKGTNIGATIRAIEGFAEPIVLIAGGLSKGVDFAPLKEHIRGKVKKVVLIGQAAPDMEKILGGTVDSVRASSMEDAVKIAFSSADPGDVVLLSPACASFDMFKDYADRGRAFAGAVRKIMSDGE